jgi:hypothetical protein
LDGFRRAQPTPDASVISNGRFMGRKSLEEFLIDERERILVAVNLSEAEKAEEILNENKIDYAINIELYYRISPFQTEHQGAAFYVKSDNAESCRKILKEKGLSAGVVDI